MVKKQECTFGLVLEQKVTNNEQKMEEGFDRVINELKDLKLKVEDLTKEVTDRPSKQANRQVKLLMWLCGGMTGIITTLVGVLIYNTGI